MLSSVTEVDKLTAVQRAAAAAAAAADDDDEDDDGGDGEENESLYIRAFFARNNVSEILELISHHSHVYSNAQQCCHS